VPLRRSSSFKVTDFGTHRKLICDFLLVTNASYLLSCTVSKLRPIIGQIFASNRDRFTLRLSLGVIPCEYSDKLYLPRN